MARSPINLETLLEEEAVQRDLQQVKYAEPPVEEQIAPAPEEVSEPIIEPSIRTVEEPERVAGGRIDLFTNLAKKAIKRIETAEERATPQGLPEAMEQRGEDIIVRKATPEEEDQLAATLGVSKKYTKGLNLPAIAEAAKDIDMAEYLQKIKDDNADLFETVRRGTISYEHLLKMAEEKGVDNIVREFIRPGRKEVMRAEDVLAGLIGADELSKRTMALARNAVKINDPERRAEAMAGVRKAAQVEAMLYAQISGEVSEAGRTQFAMREAQRVGLTTSRGEEIEALLTDSNMINNERFVNALMAIPEGPGKAKFLQRTMVDKSLDFLSESFVNSILTSPVSHAVNIAGNTGFSIYRGAEEAVAASIGLARSAITGNKDRVYYRESLIQLSALLNGFIDASIISAKSLKRGEPISEGTKLDMRTRRAIGTTDDFGEVIDMYRKGDIWTAFVNTYGVYNRMGLRFLTAEDEFFKAIQYQAEIKKEAYRRGLDIYDLAIDAGKTKDQARIEMAEEVARIIASPPSPVRKTAGDISKEVTFQADMGKTGAMLTPIMSHPLAKLFAIPVYKTPTNVMKETIKRSPFAAGHAFYTMMAKGGREGDIAMARFATGTGAFSMFAWYSTGQNTPDNDVIITGSRLSDKNAQMARDRLKIQDFSINIKQPDGTYKSYTYSRLDPLSGLFAMSADFAYYAQHSDISWRDPEETAAELAELASHAGLALFNYSLEMPFLQGVSELGAIFSGSDNENTAERLSEFLAERSTTAVLSTLPSVSSFAAGVERLEAPERTETRMVSEQFGDVADMPAPMRGFYLALQKAKSRNPFFNDNLPPALNLWGEKLMAGKGVGYEMISPIRIQDAKYSGVDKEIIRLGAGLSMPRRTIDGVRLSAEQYNRLIMLSAKTDYAGRMPPEYDEDGKLISGHPEYVDGQTLLDELQEEIYSPIYAQMVSDTDRIEELRTILSHRNTDARAALLQEYPELAAKIEALK